MKIGAANNLRDAWGVVSFTGRKKARDFDNTVDEIRQNGEVKPYFFQEGNLPRVAGSGYYTYLLKTDGNNEVFIDREVIKDENKLKREVQFFADEPKETTLILIDGGGYSKGAIISLPNYERTFVLFPPYSADRAVHLTEAKKYLGKQKFQKSSSGIERVPFKR